MPMKRLSELHDMNSDIKRLWTDARANGPEREPGSLISLATDQDVARLREAVDQLNLSLDKADRRINRLLGEKKQLSTLLDKRDGQVERLHRELGAYGSAKEVASARGDRSSRFRVSLPTLFASATERIRTYFVERPGASKALARSDRSEAPAKTSDKSPRLVARHKVDIGQQVIAVLLFGLTKSEIERLLPVIERDCSSKRMVPLCLVDMDAFELLRGRGLIFEFLPSADDRDRFDSELNWDLYIQRRLALIRRKWDPVRLVAFGAPAMKTLRLWSSSPFEASPLPAASNAPTAP